MHYSNPNVLEVFYASALREQDDYVYNALVTVMQLHESEPIEYGHSLDSYHCKDLSFSEDMLVFLTGQDEIDGAVRRARECSRGMTRRLHAIGLYAAMNTNAQMKAFRRLAIAVRKSHKV